MAQIGRFEEQAVRQFKGARPRDFRTAVTPRQRDQSRTVAERAPLELLPVPGLQFNRLAKWHGQSDDPASRVVLAKTDFDRGLAVLPLACGGVAPPRRVTAAAQRLRALADARRAPVTAGAQFRSGAPGEHTRVPGRQPGR